MRGFTGHTNAYSCTLLHHVTSFNFLLFNLNKHIFTLFPQFCRWPSKSCINIFLYVDFTIHIFRALSVCPVAANIYSRELHVKRGHQNLPEVCKAAFFFFFLVEGKHYLVRLTHHFWGHIIHFHLKTFLLFQ